MSDRLPPPPAPQGRYAAAAIAGGFGFSAGMTPRVDGALTVRGRVGSSVTVDTAQQAAGLAAANAVAAIAAAAGGIEHIDGWVRLVVYIAAEPGFDAHSLVADGASAAVTALIAGTGGVRTAVGVSSLPSGAPVEVELTVRLRAGSGGAHTEATT